MIARRATDWLARQHRRVGADIARKAQHDFAAGQLQRQGPQLRLANLLALLVLAIPLIAVGAGLFFIWQFAPAILGIAFGALLIALGVFLFPRRPKLPNGLLRRTDLPQSFAMLDEICARLATPPITGIAIDTSFNAYVTEIGRERVLGFGAVMWAALTDDERLAVLGHEVAHLVNGDPARRGLIAKALQTTNRWLMMLSPEGTGVAAEVVLVPLALCVELLEAALLRLMYLESQRAEYLADALGATLSGRDAAVATLEKTALAELLSREMGAMIVGPGHDARNLLERLARAISAPQAEERDRMLANMRAALMTTDQSHPPTAHRVSFLQAVSVPRDAALDASALFAPMRAEWDVQVMRQAEKMAAAAEIQ